MTFALVCLAYLLAIGAVAALATWLAMFVLFRISSLAAITASLLAPVFQWLLMGPGVTTIAVAAMSLLLLLRHRDNIKRLLSGEEGRVGSKAKP